MIQQVSHTEEVLRSPTFEQKISKFLQWHGVVGGCDDSLAFANRVVSACLRAWRLMFNSGRGIDLLLKQARVLQNLPPPKLLQDLQATLASALCTQRIVQNLSIRRLFGRLTR